MIGRLLYLEAIITGWRELRSSTILRTSLIVGNVLGGLVLMSKFPLVLR
jgi:hypothetical protein